MGFNDYFSKKKENLITGTKKTIGVEQIGKNFEYMKSDFETLININKEKNEKKEELSFNQMVEKYEITEEMIEKKYKDNALIFFIMFGMSFISFGLTIYYFLESYLMSSFVGLIVFFVILAKMLECSVYCFRLKQKRFSTIKEWWKSGEIVPSLKGIGK